MAQDDKSDLARSPRKTLRSIFCVCFWISAFIFFTVKIFMFVASLAHFALLTPIIIADYREQTVTHQMKQEYQELMEEFFEEHEDIFECAKEPFLQEEIFATHDGSEWSVFYRWKHKNKPILADEAVQAIDDLFQDGQLKSICYLTNGITDGVKFQFQSDDRSWAPCIIYTDEAGVHSNAWDTSFELLEEEIVWLNDNWYMSFGVLRMY